MFNLPPQMDAARIFRELGENSVVILLPGAGTPPVEGNYVVEVVIFVHDDTAVTNTNREIRLADADLIDVTGERLSPSDYLVTEAASARVAQTKAQLAVKADWL